MLKSLLWLIGACAAVLCGSTDAHGQACIPHWLTGEGLAGVAGTVNAMVEWDPDGTGPVASMLIVGGSFQIAGSANASNIAAWNGQEWEGLGEGLSSAVNALTVFNNEIIAGGSFLTASGVTVNRIARWDGSAWQPLGTGMNAAVNALVVVNAELIAGGSFTTAGGVEAARIARWDDKSWQPVGIGMNGDVNCLTIYEGMLTAGGGFTMAGGTTAQKSAMWDGTMWYPFGNDSFVTRVVALTVYDGHLIAARHQGNRVIARWTGSAWQEIAVASGGTGSLGAIVVYDNELVVGGGFSTIGGISATNIAKWNGQSWTQVGSGLSGFSGIAATNALATFGNQLIAGGSFWGASSALVDNIARWNGANWSSLGQGSDPGIEALAEYHGDLIIGGSFRRFGGINAWGIARWTGSSWQQCGGRGVGGESARVYDLIVFEGELMVGGEFLAAGGIGASNVAAWNGTQWRPLGAGLPGFVRAFTIYGGQLVAAGNVPNGIQRWNGSTWQPFGPVNGAAECLIVYNGDLVVGGAWQNQTQGLLRWNGANWETFAGGTTGAVRAMTIYNGDLIVAGSFTSAGGTSAARIARWNGAT